MMYGKNQMIIVVTLTLILGLFSPMIHGMNDSESLSSSSENTININDYRLAEPDGNRYSTAGHVALRHFGSAEKVIIVRGDSEGDLPQVVDSLAAAGLAGAETRRFSSLPKTGYIMIPRRP